MSTRRRYLATATTFSALAACAPGANEPAGQAPAIGQRDVGLIWQVEMQVPELDKVPGFLSEWNQRYPRVKVEAQHFGGGDGDKIEKMLTMAAAGTPVDVVGKLTFLQPLAAPGGLRPIDALVKRDKYDVSKYNKNWLNDFDTYEGKLYGFPYGLGGSAIIRVWITSSCGSTAPMRTRTPGSCAGSPTPRGWRLRLRTESRTSPWSRTPG